MKTLHPGTYLMTWGGYTQRVTVRQARHGLMVTVASGYEHTLETFEGATFTEI